MTEPVLTVYNNGVNQVSGDQLNTFQQTCINMAQLRGFQGVGSMEVSVQGFSVSNDGGQGSFYWNAIGTAPDDNGVTTVVPNGAAAGCWTRLGSGAVATIVNSVTATNTTLTISPVTGAVLAGLNLASVNVWTGTQSLPTGSHAVTQSPGDNTLNIATTAFVTAAVGAAGLFAQVPAITGFLPTAISGSATTAAVTVTSGLATTLAGTALMSKNTSTSWSVANGNVINGFSGGTTLPTNSTIAFFICAGGSGTGVFASTSLTPSFPTGYTTSTRRIFNLKTNSSGALIPVVTDLIEGGAIESYLVTQTTDSNTTLGATSRTLIGVNVPGLVKMRWKGVVGTVTNNTAVLVTSPDQTDVAPVNNFTGAPGCDAQNGAAGNYPDNVERITNTSGQIGVRPVTPAIVFINSRSWVDFRIS